MVASTNTTGRITQVIGSTFDAEFEEDSLPSIYNAVKVKSSHKKVEIDLTGEVQQHLGGGRVRCVALGSTDGLTRGQDCVDTGAPVSVPVGDSNARPRLQRARRTDRWPRRRSKPKNAGRSTASHPRWPNCRRTPNCSKPGSK